MLEKPIRLVHNKHYRVSLLFPLKTIGTFTVLLLGNRWMRDRAMIGFRNLQLMPITKQMVDEGLIIFEERLD